MADENDLEVSSESIPPGAPPEKKTNSKKTKPVCRFYAKSGVCKYKENCRFSHAKSADIDTTSSQENNDKVTELPEENEQQKSESNSITKKKRCRYFNTKKGCSKGDACPFAHKEKKENNQKEDKLISKNIAGKTKETDESKTAISTTGNKDAADTKPMTPNKEKTSSSKSKPNISTSQNKKESEKKTESKTVVSTTAMLSALDDDQLEKLRTREIEQLLRRFGKKKATEMPCSDGTMYSVLFAPSDPDWPFDIENIVLEVTFPREYPKKMFDAALSQDQSLPSDLISFVNQGILKWTQQQQQIRDKKDSADLPFRPFLRWLDRNIEKLFIDAAKQMKEQEEHEDENTESDSSEDAAQGPCSSSVEAYEPNQRTNNVENVYTKPRQDYQHQQQAPQSHSYHDAHPDKIDILLSDLLTFKSQPPKNKVAGDSKSHHHGDTIDMSKKEHIVFVEREPNDSSTNQMSYSACGDVMQLESTGTINWADTMTNVETEQSSEGVGQQPKPRGTEIRFKGLELYENTSTLRTDTVVLTVDCAKCKTKTDVKTDKLRPAAIRCEKCTNIIKVGFRPFMIHQYSTSTLGYLDLHGCHPFDLVIADSSLIAGCLGCSHETPIKGPQYGSNQVWCSKCHQKLQFKIESTRFFQLMPTSSVPGDSNVPMPKRKPKAPGLREGFPLPENGTCKHYKKSFRWLRFPCCGKCYPCDVCHDEVESHEMKYATRMVCGFCSKEQPFTQGSCSACNSSITKAKSSHWEGGKGCRNKTVMSKGDDKKYKNTSKTTSRKSQAKANPGKSK